MRNLQDKPEFKKILLTHNQGNMRKLILMTTVLFLFSGLNLMANKTSVEIKAPATVKKGSEVTITINVTHKGNTKMHHTDWVILKLNGKEVKKWEYTKESLPATENFKLEYKMTVTEDASIEVQGDCNLHGSAGPKTIVIKTTQP
jgi:desulfoferrodoxin (superoxide reductase-like protein)